MDLNPHRNTAMQQMVNRRNAELRGASGPITAASRPVDYSGGATITTRGRPAVPQQSFDPSVQRYADAVDQYRAGANAPGGGVATGLGLAARSAIGGGVASVVDEAQQLGDLVKPIYQGARAFITGDTPGGPANAVIDPSRDAVIHPSLAQARRGYGMNDRGVGPLANAANAVPGGPIASAFGRTGAPLPTGITRTGNSYGGVGGVDDASTGAAQQPMTTDQANQFFGSQLAAMNAREDRDVQAGRASQLALAARGTAQQESQKADREASVANFLAKNGADVVGGITYRGRNPARDSAAAAAYGANARAAGARGAFNASDANLANAGKTSYIDDFAKSQQAELAGKAAADAMQGQQTQQQTAQLDLAARQQIADLDKQIAAEKDPKKLQVLQSKRLALAGKVATPKFAIIDSEGPPDAFGNPTKLKVAVNTETGEILRASAPQPPTPPENHVAALRADPKNQTLRAQFDAKYGTGAAQRVLGN